VPPAQAVQKIAKESLSRASDGVHEDAETAPPIGDGVASLNGTPGGVRNWGDDVGWSLTVSPPNPGLCAATPVARVRIGLSAWRGAWRFVEENPACEAWLSRNCAVVLKATFFAGPGDRDVVQQSQGRVRAVGDAPSFPMRSMWPRARLAPRPQLDHRNMAEAMVGHHTLQRGATMVQRLR